MTGSTLRTNSTVCAGCTNRPGATPTAITDFSRRRLSWPSSGAPVDVGERRLISLISTKGKSVEQLKAEAHQALQKYFDANPESRPPNYPADDGVESMKDGSLPMPRRSGPTGTAHAADSGGAS